MLIYDVNQLKDKGAFVLENVKRRYSALDEDLKEIHCNYVKCMEKVITDKVIDHKVNSLTHQRDNLKKELQGLKDLADENNKKLMEIKKVVMVQEVRFHASMYVIPTWSIVFYTFFLFTEKKYGTS